MCVRPYICCCHLFPYSINTIINRSLQLKTKHTVSCYSPVSQEADSCSSDQYLYILFFNPNLQSPCPKQTLIRPHPPEPTESSPIHSKSVSLTRNLLLFSHLNLCLESCLFPLGFPTKFRYAYQCTFRRHAVKPHTSYRPSLCYVTECAPALTTHNVPRHC